MGWLEAVPLNNKRHFDIIVNIPLEEELNAFLNIFEHKEDYSSDAQYRCTVHTGTDVTMLVVVQDEMGKSSASNSTTEALNEFSCELFICLGIAGGLSKDLRAIWLSDLELGYGEELLNETTKTLPKLSLLRICISEYLLKQVYWTHAKKDHRLKLLDIAESVLKKVSLNVTAPLAPPA